MQDGNCEDCAAWRSTGPHGGFGECHRFAPMMRPSDKSDSAGTVAWPITIFDDWCLDFVEKTSE